MLMDIENFDSILGKQFKEYYEKTAKCLKGTNPNNIDVQYERMREISVPHSAISYIRTLYEDGYGLKVIGRHIGLSYSKMRTAFNRCNIPIRSGRNVYTDKTTNFRSIKAFDSNPWKDWPKHHPNWADKSRSGISGYYLKKDGKLVWLRSTWEYIYAKWLDKNNIQWDFEYTTYNLSNGTSYRPDFFIFENGKLSSIIEIKGYYDNRAYKADMLKRETGLPIIIIDDISNYCESYGKELTEWKEYINANKNN